MRLTLLGTGTSFGVPQIGCACAVCRSDDPRDRRTRTSALLEAGDRRLLIDTPPELRLQLLQHGVGRLDAVLFTHDHADHVHGIDDLRIFSAREGHRLPAYGAADTLMRLASRFPYIFDPAIVAGPATSLPDLAPTALEAGRPTAIAGIGVLPIAFQHAGVTVLGYRFGPVAYATDVKVVPKAAREQLRGVRFLVVSALFERQHPAHLSIPEAVALADELGVERTWLTHLTHETGHAALEARLPEHVRPAYDGLVLEVEE